ncbi:hypothetical protein GCM10018980_31870 [Streptomyces capoamus]|uniref:Uncharacterized protein n=1 Tax=Streptomyces capoamus TaxID=68183 RepID=A0A919C4X5_9ACTN|nr:hypothetical protein GCM10010501_39730 [Streptomyces libani subsp. rufus]GHG50164.1 hypothetical protein GCM10018980_31870 [Streptomyces capoamus]
MGPGAAMRQAATVGFSMTGEVRRMGADGWGLRNGTWGSGSDGGSDGGGVTDEVCGVGDR